jgi:hypothetical protein
MALEKVLERQCSCQNVISLAQSFYLASAYLFD